MTCTPASVSRRMERGTTVHDDIANETNECHPLLRLGSTEPSTIDSRSAGLVSVGKVGIVVCTYILYRFGRTNSNPVSNRILRGRLFVFRMVCRLAIVRYVQYTFSTVGLTSAHLRFDHTLYFVLRKKYSECRTRYRYHCCRM